MVEGGNVNPSPKWNSLLGGRVQKWLFHYVQGKLNVRVSWQKHFSWQGIGEEDFKKIICHDKGGEWAKAILQTNNGFKQTQIYNILLYVNFLDYTSKKKNIKKQGNYLNNL